MEVPACGTYRKPTTFDVEDPDSVTPTVVSEPLDSKFLLAFSVHEVNVSVVLLADPIDTVLPELATIVVEVPIRSSCETVPKKKLCIPAVIVPQFVMVIVFGDDISGPVAKLLAVA